MVTSTVISNDLKILSLEDWIENPPEHTEWIDGELVEKTGITLKHSKVQGNLSFYWRNHQESSQQRGKIYINVPCRTNKHGRFPDVAYLTPELVAQYGSDKVLPQSFPLSAEIVSPTDLAEDVIAKAQEYLQSGGQEVWLVYPENCWIIVVTNESRKIFIAGEIVRTQKILLGFSISVDELLA